MAKLSVVINTYNEAKILPRALKSVKGLTDEIVVVDTESTDNIKEVAKEFGANLFSHEFVSYVEPVRNFSISKATGDWVLILDADEEVGPELAEEIKRVINNNEADYYKIPRKNIVFGKWLKYSRWWPDYIIRLFKKGSVIWNEAIHSVPETHGVGSELPPSEDLAIVHHHYNSIDQFVERLNRYTSQQAKAKILTNYKFSWRDIINKPVEEFLSRYFFGQGYKDGIHGLAVSLLQAFSELVLYLKLWQSEKFREEEIDLKDVISEMSAKEKNLHYWQNDALYKETGSTTARIRRKLQI